MTTKGKRRPFGQVTRMRSGRYQARYTGPDYALHTAGRTFDAEIDASAWLKAERALVDADTWAPPKYRNVYGPSRTLGAYSAAWLEARTLKPRTREHYQRMLDRLILPTFAASPLKNITPDFVRDWHTNTATETPTLRAHAYSLLRSILTDAVHDGLIPANPAHIRGAGNSKRVHKVKPATLPELAVLVGAMPDRFKTMTLIAAWCGLRFGELTELRRSDIDLKGGVIRVRRGVVRTDDGYEVGTPKSAAGIRDVAIPPHLVPTIRVYLHNNVNGRAGLLFPASDGVSHLAPSSLYGRASTSKRAGWGFYHAREVAGRPDLRWHDLRHTGAVLAASTGATLAELMARLGHSTAGAALRYQHAAAGRDAVIAAKLSELAARQ